MSKKSRFDEVFFPGENDNKISKALMKYINQGVPKGYEYCKFTEDKDVFFLKSKKNKKNQKILFDLNIKYPIEHEGVSVNNIVQLQEIIYRTQKPYELKKEVLGYDVVKSLKGDVLTSAIVPAMFDEVEPILILIGEKKINVPVRRVPMASLIETKLESLSDFPLKLVIVLNESNRMIKIKTGLNFNVIKTIDDYFENFNLILNFYSDEEFIIWGNKFSRANAIEIFQTNNKFYKRLKYIQEKTKVKFEIQDKISNSEVVMVNHLYQNLRHDRVVKQKIDGILTLTFDPKKEKVENLARKFPELGSFFVCQTKEFKILNVTLVLEEYILHEGLKIKKIDSENNELELEIIENGCDYLFYHVGYGEPYMYTADEFMKKIERWISFEESKL